MAEEFLPFGVGGDAVFLGGPQCASPGQEREVGLDRLGGIDRLVAESDVDVLVSGDDLGDVRGQAGEDGVGDENPSEIVGSVM